MVEYPSLQLPGSWRASKTNLLVVASGGQQLAAERLNGIVFVLRGGPRWRSQLPHLPWLERTEAFRCNPGRVACGRKVAQRGVNWLVGQLKGAVVMAEGEFGARVQKGLDC